MAKNTINYKKIHSKQYFESKNSTCEGAIIKYLMVGTFIG